MLKEESGPVIRVFEDGFVRAAQFRYLNTGDRKIVKEHLFGRLKDSVDEDILVILEGFEVGLEQDEVD